MCGRLSQATAVEKAARALRIVNELPALPYRYNVAPSLPLAAVRQSPDGRNEWSLLRWGLIPSWAGESKSAYKMINAKAETLAQRPAYREALRYRRCIIPADGFYEWRRRNKARQPYYVYRAQGEPLYFAGLWDRWQGEGQVIESCTIVTTDANALVAPLHDRMPAILTTPDEAFTWLDMTRADAKGLGLLLKPYAGPDLRIHAVSQRVNNPRNDDESCIAAIAEPD